MFRFIFQIFLCLSLMIASGCSVMWKSSFKNSSSDEIFVLDYGSVHKAWIILPNQQLEINWAYDCMSISTKGKFHYFSTNDVPEGAFSSSGFNQSVNATFKNAQLFYVLDSGDYIKAPKINSCENTLQAD